MYSRRQDPTIPLPTFQGMQEEVNRLFNDVLGRGSGPTRSWAPPVEIYERGDELFVMAELPGFEREEVQISLEDGQLTISGERKVPDTQGLNIHRSERWYGRFERSFQLPATYNTEAIAASLKNGVLTITLPKREESKARQIPVSAAS